MTTLPTEKGDKWTDRLKRVTVEEFFKPTFYVAILALIVAGWSCHISQEAEDRSRESLYVGVAKQSGKESLVNLKGAPAIKVHWVVDITNLSDDATSIVNPEFELNDGKGNPASFAFDPKEMSRQPPPPIYLASKQSTRIEKDTYVYLNQDAAKLAITSHYPSLSKWRKLAQDHHLNEFGQSQENDGLRLNVFVTSVDGVRFEGSYDDGWDGGFDPGAGGDNW